MNWPVFIGVTVILAGGAAWMMGQSLANTWRPVWQVFIYALLLGLADRFMIFALFEGELLSLKGFIVDSATLLIIGLIAWRVNQVKMMIKQYPWLYRRASLLHWVAHDSA
jgi:hypothetical protein